MHFFLSFFGVIFIAIFCKSIASGLFGLISCAGAGVGFIDDEAVLELSVGLEGLAELFFIDAFVDVSDVEAGVCLKEGGLVVEE